MSGKVYSEEVLMNQLFDGNEKRASRITGFLHLLSLINQTLVSLSVKGLLPKCLIAPPEGQDLI